MSSHWHTKGTVTPSRKSKLLRISGVRTRNWDQVHIFYRNHHITSALPTSVLHRFLLSADMFTCLVVRSLGQSWSLWNGLKAEQSESRFPSLLSALYPPGLLYAGTRDHWGFFSICVGFWRWNALTILFLTAYFKGKGHQIVLSKNSREL